MNEQNSNNHNCKKPQLSVTIDNPKAFCERVNNDKKLKETFQKAMNEYKKQLFDYFICRFERKPQGRDLDLIKKAFDIAFEAHFCQFRKAGKREPYITHPVEVALIVANEMGLDIIAIVSALLHDVLEDAPELFDYEDIKREFGEAVAITVDGVTKMTKLGGKSSNERLETFRKMIYSISKEYRVILIKIADRLHNMRTMEGMPREKQKIKSSENLYVYSQFAKAVGMFDIKNEMEDLSFKYLYPEEYNRLKQLDEKLKPYRDKFLNDLKIELYKILQPLGYNFEIKRVRRSLYEIWHKLKQYPDLSFEDIHNRESLRIVVDIDEKDVYQAALNIFGEITKVYEYPDDSIKNYIIRPKPNGFRALIFDIIYQHPPTRGILPQKAEIQILSKHDDIVAQKGANFEQLKHRFSLQKQDESVAEFIERILRELETDYIYVYTPKGDIIQLPKGSSVLDFAFKIHTDLGLHCIGARINFSVTKSPFYKLKSGEIVQVLSSNKIEPEFEWLKYVITPKARNAIMNYLKSKDKTQPKPAEEKQSQSDLHTDKLPIVVDKYADFKFADCCNPTPETEAVAIQDEKGNIIIHKADCPKLAAIANPDNLVPVKWAIKDSLYKITLTAMDRIGLLKDVAELISNDLHINMKEVHMKIDDMDKLVVGEVIVKVHHNGTSENCKDKKGCSPQEVKVLMEKMRKIEGIINVSVQMKI